MKTILLFISQTSLLVALCLLYDKNILKGGKVL